MYDRCESGITRFELGEQLRSEGYPPDNLQTYSPRLTDLVKAGRAIIRGKRRGDGRCKQNVYIADDWA
jgi:hypothetical protein